MSDIEWSTYWEWKVGKLSKQETAKVWNKGNHMAFLLKGIAFGWWFQMFFIFPPTWGNDPIWRAYFSNGLNSPTSPPSGSFFEGWFVCSNCFKVSFCFQGTLSDANEVSCIFCWQIDWHGGIRLGSLYCLAGGFKYVVFFTPSWGDDQIWLIFLQMGWNHQLVVYCICFVIWMWDTRCLRGRSSAKITLYVPYGILKVQCDSNYRYHAVYIIYREYIYCSYNYTYNYLFIYICILGYNHHLLL